MVVGSRGRNDIFIDS